MVAEQQQTQYIYVFDLAVTNFTSMVSIGEVRNFYRFIVTFMNNSYLKKELTESPPLIRLRLDEFSSYVACERDKTPGTIKFTMKAKSYTIVASVINKALAITLGKGEHFQGPASDETLEKFLKTIGCSGLKFFENSGKWYLTGEMDKIYLRKE